MIDEEEKKEILRKAAVLAAMLTLFIISSSWFHSFIHSPSSPPPSEMKSEDKLLDDTEAWRDWGHLSQRPVAPADLLIFSEFQGTPEFWKSHQKMKRHSVPSPF